MERYTISKAIAESLYGEVWLATEKSSKIMYAIKTINLQYASMKRTLKDHVAIEENIFVELAVNKKISQPCDSSLQYLHNNIVRMKESFEENGYMYMVFEYCSKGELFDSVFKANRFPTDKARHYFMQIVGGLKFLHSNGYAHRDLSLENVLVDEDDNAKLCDFGLAIDTCQNAKDIVGKLYYMAPEVSAGDNYDPIQADLWSLGIVLFILLSGTPLFEKPCVSDPRFQFVKERGLKELLSHWGIESKLPPAAIDLICKLVVVNPTERISLDQVLNHPWLNSKIAVETHHQIVLTVNEEEKKESATYFSALSNFLSCLLMLFSKKVVNESKV